MLTSNQVWCTDITYIPMAKGFVYLCAAIIDWHSRKVLAHRVSISMKTDFCIDAFIDVLKSNGIQISMDGKLAQYTAHR